MSKIILSIILGSAFGFALYYAGAANRKNLRAMLRLEDLTLMKTILYGIGFASVLIGSSTLLGILDTAHFSIKSMNAGVLIGGAIFGIGFGLIGSCPGTSVASLPYANKVKTLGIVAGGLFGAFLFSLTYGNWVASGVFQALNLGKLTIFKISPKFPALFVMGAEGLLLLGLGFIIISYFLPTKFKL